jgi:ketosteroid isomerase-like protein
VSDYEARAFINAFYRLVEAKDLNNVVSQYADRANYLEYGVRDRGFIRQDYISYYKRWPSVSFTVDEVRVDTTPNVAGATASFNVQYVVRNPGANRSKSGRAHEEWTLTPSGEGLKITAHRETVYSGGVPLPVAPTVPAGPQTNEAETVRQFIREYLGALQRRDLNAALVRFDKVVNYQGTGKKTRAYIRGDLLKYLSKWTQLNYEVGPIDVSKGSDGQFAASFYFDYTVSNSSEQKRGRSSNQWVIRMVQGSLRIVSQQESVQRY